MNSGVRLVPCAHARSAPFPSEGSDIICRVTPFLRGMRLGLPVLLGYLPVGLAFGVLAGTAGFSTWQAAVCSGTALAGAGQFISLNLLVQGSSATGALAASAVVNLRYVLFGGSIAPYLRGRSLASQAALAFFLTDETYAINITDLREGTATPLSMLGVGVISWLGWVAGTLLGVLGADLIADPSAWGLDFAMPAMFTALLLALAENRRQAAASGIAGVIAISLVLAQMAGLPLGREWFVVIASISTATLSAAVFR